VTAAEEGTRIEVLLEHGNEIDFILAPDQDPLPPKHDLFLLEPAVYEEMRSVADARRVRETLAGKFPAGSHMYRRLWFGENRTATVRGLTPGSYRLTVLPDDIEVLPTEIHVSEEGGEPTVLRWSWK
jgi:hypothetical protein